MRSAKLLSVCLLASLVCAFAAGQGYCPPDRDAPGDQMIQAYLARETEKIEADSPEGLLKGIHSQEDWQRIRPKYQEEYFYMLGLWPLPARTPLDATLTGTLQRDGYVVDMVHYQSRPAAVRDRKPVPPGEREAGRAPARGILRVRAFQPGPAG